MKRIDTDQRALAERLFRAKATHRQQVAALPIKEKIRILIEMQRLSNDVRRKTGRKLLPEWDIEP